MKLSRIYICSILAAIVAGCAPQTSTTTNIIDPHAQVQAENNIFLFQKTFDPWVLTSTDPNHKIPVYLGSGVTGSLYDSSGNATQTYEGGNYDRNGVIVSHQTAGAVAGSSGSYSQTLDLMHGTLTTSYDGSSHTASALGDWPTFWKKSDIVVVGDPEAQQATHAELFDLCSSVEPGTDHSVPPMGLSSNVYDGHIFWDAEIWMLPALLPQHPDLARSIVDYRFNRLKPAEKLAAVHGFKGAEYPWESAATGLEEAPQQFSHERHITADVAYAAWQYYLWTGDRSYLSSEGWPVLCATAQYWASRAKLGSDGKYHVANVIGPDETAGQVTDDAWTNGVVRYNLLAAERAATITGHHADPKWSVIAEKIEIPFDSSASLYLQYPAMDRSFHQAKQADTQMLIYPLNLPMSSTAALNTLDYCLNHTIQFGPAMTSSIDAVIAARLGRSAQSLDLYRNSYRPFMRGPWDAFSEKRTMSDVYFTTGIGGTLQSVLYGFAGIDVQNADRVSLGRKIAQNGDATLYCNPHLPPGWTELTVKGIHFRGAVYSIDIKPGGAPVITKG